MDNSVNLGGAPKAPWWETVSLRTVALGTACVVLTLLAVALVIALRYVFIMLFLGVVVATALAPIAERLRRLRIGRGLAILIAFVFLIAAIIGIIVALTPFFIDQVSLFASELPQFYANFRNSLTAAKTPLISGLAQQLPTDPFAGTGSDGGFALGVSAASYLPSLGRGFLFGVLVLLLSYYWLYYRSLAIQSMALLVPIDQRTGAIELWNEIEFKCGAFVRGLAILGLVIGVLSAAGYALIGLPYAFTIGIIAGLLEAVPYVGPFITMAISVVVGISVSPTTAILALVVALIVQFVENSVVVPRVMDRAVGVNPVVTLLALTIFAELFGLLGALLAVPLAAAFQVLLDRLMTRNTITSETELGGRDRFALLRYRTHDLASDLRQRVRIKTEETSAEEDAVEEELEALLVDLDGLLISAQEQRS